jgi:hypothetical protein
MILKQNQPFRKTHDITEKAAMELLPPELGWQRFGESMNVCF